VAAARVAPLPIAFAVSLLTPLLATKLYNFPKVLLLAAAALLLTQYSRVQSRAAVVGFGVLTVVAFLFRHDYAAYVGVGALAVIALAAGSLKRAFVHLLGYGGVTLLLLVPSIVFVQRHGGLAAYIADSRLAVRQELNRTARLEHGFVFRDEAGTPLSVGGFLNVEQNAVEWLYYVHIGLPILVLLALWAAPAPRNRTRAGLAACAVMALVVAPAFLRGNTGARFGDMVPVTGVLLAGLCALALQPGGHAGLRIAKEVAVLVLVLATVQSVWTIGEVSRQLEVSGWTVSLGGVGRQAARRWTELEALPSAYWNDEPSGHSVATIRYLHACTRPSDRILVISYQPELLPLADRRFAGGRASLIPGLLTDEEHQQKLVKRWQRERVPIVLVEPAPEHIYEIPIVYKHLITWYAHRGQLEVDGHKILDVFVDANRQPARTDARTGLPCY
jgi:hypothetical protein